MKSLGADSQVWGLLRFLCSESGARRHLNLVGVLWAIPSSFRITVKEVHLCLFLCFFRLSLTSRSCLCVLGTQILLGSDSALVKGRGAG